MDPFLLLFLMLGAVFALFPFFDMWTDRMIEKYRRNRA